MKINTIIVPIIQNNFIGRFLETLYKYTPDNFYVFVVDQTQNDEAYIKYHQKVHLWIKVYRNLGFSKAMNMGIKLAQTEYITLSNDDVEFIDKRWWQGIEDTFATDERIIACNPMSPKEGAFGYGLQVSNKDTWQPPEGFVQDPNDPESVVPDIGEKQPFVYKKEFTPQDYDFLVNNHPRWKKDTMCDAICMWCTVFKKSGLEEIGLLDERFYPGGGEDYDMNARAYSCAWPKQCDVCDPEYHKRMVATTKSWVWHHWGKSKNMRMDNLKSPLFQSRQSWNDNDALWKPKLDVWGHETINDVKKPIKRDPNVFIDEL